MVKISILVKHLIEKTHQVLFLYDTLITQSKNEKTCNEIDVGQSYI